MKIGIITFHASYNCGSILQCIALKHVLEDKGEQVKIINFSSKEQQKLYSVLYKKINLKNIVKNILCLPGYGKIKDHYSQYEKYIQEVFDIQEDFLETSQEIKDKEYKFDMLIAGGDQIWNVNCDDFDTAYFLDFDQNTYKISYAPSLGATDINESPNASEYKILLNKFNDLSCREVNGAKWLEKLTGKRIKLIADPTLLLLMDEWKKEIKKPLKLSFKEKFIFYYAFSYSPENNERIQQIAEQNNLKVVVIDAKQWYIKGLGKYRNFVLCKETGPNAFLNLMNLSEYVVTTSFHGTIFSLVFHKKFVYINGKNHKSTDDRTSFLLEQLELMNKYIYVEDVSADKLNEEIKYDDIDHKIEQMKIKANKYIDENISKAKEEMK